MQASPEDKERGDRAELKFKEWLDRHNIPYFYIKQDPEAFASAFKNGVNGKRPDFMILLPNFGFIFVDVKNKRLNQDYKTYPLDSYETKKYSEIQRLFNLHIWYVLSNEDCDFRTWFWIPISRVLEAGMPRFNSSKSKEDFYAVPPEEFIQISEDDSIDRLFSKSLS